MFTSIAFKGYVVYLMRNYFSSLGYRNYRYYFAGQLVSLIGTWMQHTAMAWLVYRLTGSLLLLGVVGFTSQIPMFFLTPFTGVFTDWFNRHKLMLLSQVLFFLQALILALLVIFNLIQIWHIIVLSLLFGVISAIDAPARQSLVVDLIDEPSQLGNAIALNSALFNFARVIGPGIAGLIIYKIGEGYCLLINAVSYFSIIYALVKIKTQPKQQNCQPNWKESFKDGFQYTFGNLPIRMLIILLAALSLMGISFSVIMPAYVKEILHGNSQTLGFLMSATGIGALIGALFLASRKTIMGMERLIYIHTLIFGVCVFLLSFSEYFWVSLIFLSMAGFSMIVAVASINTLIQTLSDDDKRGRVMSFYAMALMGTTPIGNLMVGAVAGKIGIPSTLLLSGIVSTIAGVVFATRYKVLKGYIAPYILRNKEIKTEG